MPNKIGYIGIAIAVLAIIMAVFQDDLRSHFPAAAEKETSTIEKVIEKGAQVMGLAEKEEKKSSDWVSLLYVGLGVVALILAIVSYLRNENHRVSGMAGALGMVAIAWEYVLIGLMIAVVIYFLANLDF